MAQDPLFIRFFGTDTLLQMQPYLRFWSDHWGFPWRFTFEPAAAFYNHIQHPHLASSSGWLCLALPEDKICEAVRRDAAAAVSAGHKVILILLPSGLNRDTRQLIRGVSDESAAGSLEAPSIHWQNIVQTYDCPVGPSELTSKFLAGMATAILRRVAAAGGFLEPQIKVIVVDADHTLWDGVCTEDPIEDLSLLSKHESLQSFLRTQKELGKLLVLCSESDSKSVLATLAAMNGPLCADDFVILSCAIRDKSQELQKISARLRLDLSSFLFIDDSLAHCHTVRSRHPQVSVLPFVGDAHHATRHLWRLDESVLTDVNGQRTQLYAAAFQRDELRVQHEGRSDFLSSIQQAVSVRHANYTDLARVEQLSARCNRFHNDGTRWPVSRLRDHIAAGGECLVAELSDRFGDLGIVASVVMSRDPSQIDISLFLLSCRAFGRDVEFSIMGHIAHSSRHASVRFRAVETGRNLDFFRFFSAVAGDITHPGGDSLTVSCSSVLARLLPTTYGFTSTATQEVSSQFEPKVGEAPALKHVSISEMDVAASSLYSAAAVQLAASRSDRYQARLRNCGGLLNLIQEHMAAQLKIGHLGPDANFFELGGDSLAAVELLIGLEARTGIPVPLTVLFEYDFTPRELERALGTLTETMDGDAV